MSNLLKNKKAKKFNSKVWKYSWITVGVAGVAIPAAMVLDARFNANSRLVNKSGTETNNNQTENQNNQNITPNQPNPSNPQNPKVEEQKPRTEQNQTTPNPQNPKVEEQKPSQPQSPSQKENQIQPRTVDVKDLIKKQHDSWVKDGYNFNVNSGLVNSSVFGTLVSLRNLSSSNPAEIIAKINSFLPEAKDKKFAQFSTDLVALGFKLKVTNVIPDYTRKELEFQLSILDSKNQPTQFYENGPSSLTYRLRGFEKGFAIAPLDTQITSLLTNTKIGYRLDVIIPDVKTKAQALWWLQEVARQATIGVDVNNINAFEYDRNQTVAQFVDAVAAKLKQKNSKNQYYLPYLLRIVDFNPEDRLITDENKQPSYNDAGSNLIAGGRKYNQFQPYNGMDGYANTINGLEGLKKELINLLRQINKHKPSTNPYNS
ncbi:hypothetical protein [Mycoplasma amphoriforme]